MKNLFDQLIALTQSRDVVIRFRRKDGTFAMAKVPQGADLATVAKGGGILVDCLVRGRKCSFNPETLFKVQ